MKRKIIALIITLSMCFSTTAQAMPADVIGGYSYQIILNDSNATLSESGMTDKQLNAIAMLNYLTVLTQEINSSSNSKLYLDGLYSSILCNVNPSKVDSDSKYEITELLNTIESYISIETKRERLQYIYEQNRANAIQAAIPDPVSVLNVVKSGSIIKALVSVVYMAVDSATSYASRVNEVDDKYLEDGWVLDDSAAENLHKSRTSAFEYMVEMCQKNDLDGKLALNEKAVENFVKWENNPNITTRIELLENNESTYKLYGKYWLVLAESYYEKGNDFQEKSEKEKDLQEKSRFEKNAKEQYKKCIDAITSYENLKVEIFRCDKDFAQTLSVAIAASGELYEGSEYEKKVGHYLKLLLENIEPDDWALRYLAAQTCMSIYVQTKKADYLSKAYKLVKENITYLVSEQYEKNAEYMADVKKEEVPKAATKTVKEEIKSYNKWLEEERKIELPPVSEPLVVNCELLFGLADKINISKEEKEEVNEILHPDGAQLFLVKQLEEKYWFNKSPDEKKPEVVFDGDTIEIPASYLEKGTAINVTVSDNGKKTKYDDWTLKSVIRNDKNDVDSFTAKYTSKKIKKQKFSEGMLITVEIIPPEGSTYSTESFSFKTVPSKFLWVFDDVDFEMVK